ncbi:TonB family protein [Asticcacaulis sp. 201]|uniref:TonB family protein n=1 Tax=Asticcacaulis sp. 201 TaxID=3028787 RepID=UPI002915D7D1|nr:TonB family protein [Asticcacaulis sp. 201]MDV6329667.1 TonB family protein [Asticcacaulis sp. 201]
MKSAVLSISLLCGLAATGAGAQDATAYGGGVKCAPTSEPQIGDSHVFTRDGSDLSDAGEYPRPAKIASIEGQAAVDCQIGQDGYLTRCVVASESEPGYGLGQGLAVTVLKWAQTDTARPGHQAGNWLRFTTNWKLPPSQVATAENAR